MISKMRMEMRSKGERDGEEWSEEWQLEKLKSSRVVDSTAGEIDFPKRKATDIPTCRRVTLPKPVEENTEVRMRNMKLKMMEAFKDFKSKHCDDK